MATHKSAEKRARSSERKRIHNRKNISAFKTAVKKFKTAVDGVLTQASSTIDKQTLLALFADAQSRLAKAGAKGILHKNAVARKVSRLALSLKAAQERTSGTRAAAPSTSRPKKKSAASKKAAASEATTKAKAAPKTTRKPTKSKGK